MHRTKLQFDQKFRRRTRKIFTHTHGPGTEITGKRMRPSPHTAHPGYTAENLSFAKF